PNGGATDCNNSSPAVNPGAADANCDGVDNNCSGAADEQYVPTATSCGAGACSATGQNICASGTIVNTCTPGIPGVEGPMGVPVCSDSIDNDCDGATDSSDPGCLTSCLDVDGDGYGANGDASCPNGTAIDCNDNAPNINPGVSDTDCNRVDENCSGTVDEGYTPTPSTCGIGECTRSGQNVCQNGVVVNACTPGAPQTESYTVPLSCSDNKDNDCDGLTDMADAGSCNPPDVDNDGDGISENQGDCDDTNNKVYPGAPRICDGNDNDCDGRLDFSTDVDNDKDGFPICVMTGYTVGDCNDNNANINPSKRELYGTALCTDGIDNDCDKRIDALDTDCQTPCPDADGDGYSKNGSVFCPGGPQPDCDDNNAAINPGALDTNCNGMDENCSGAADEGYVTAATTCGVGACSATGQSQCQNGTLTDTCAPGAPVYEGPQGAAVCNDGIDNDCDGTTDNADTSCLTPCQDADGDGYGANGDPACPMGTAIDCNDNNANVNPAATDTNCNGVDDNCNGTADEGYVPTATSCGIGVCAATGQNVCQNGLVVNTCTPGAPQTESYTVPATCSDGTDNNCNGLTDMADVAACNPPNVDNDGDGYCEIGPCQGGAAPGDCDDTDNKVFPGAPRICDGKDNDCDGRLDLSTDVDNDKDGFPICVMSWAGYTKGDCNDNNPNVNPGKTEGPYGETTCSDGVDNNCDGKTDAADAKCIITPCGTKKTSPKGGPHFFTLLNQDGTIHSDNAALDCGKCHNGSNFTDPIRYQCQRCHADTADTSDPLNGVIKVQYPLNKPYGYGSAPNVKGHSSTLLGTRYSTWTPDCTTCHNPHVQEQNYYWGTTYDKYIKFYLCFDNTANGGGNFADRIKFTAPSGAGSFADGAPHNENVCEVCHTNAYHHRRTGTAPGDLDTGNNYIGHNDGVNCTTCHLHSEGFKLSCGTCHDVPPPTGTHLKHFSGITDQASYGGTGSAQNVTAFSTEYLFDCGNCHPLDPSKHSNHVSNTGGGDAEIELYNPGAPVGSIKSLNLPAATYTPGPTVFTDSKGMKYTQGTCSNVYCHSGPEFTTSGSVPLPTPGTAPNIHPLTYNPPWESFAISTRHYNTPTWGVDSLGCNGCHGYPILTQYPAVSAGVGDSHAWIDDYGYLDLHMWNMAFDPLQCSACHYNTARDAYTWTRTDYSITLGDIPIFNKSTHVNGTKDIAFTPDPVVYQTSTGPKAKNLSTATYDPNTKSCFNVACHKFQTGVKWGGPYRWWNSYECDVCHQNL
ncbi:MAG: hypothetical protein C4538_02350, partial [Nitrospiraceae bacterium]